jgi:hypothetical protein
MCCVRRVVCVVFCVYVMCACVRGVCCVCLRTWFVYVVCVCVVTSLTARDMDDSKIKQISSVTDSCV